MSIDTGCKEMSQEDFLQMVEENPIYKERLAEMGIMELEDGMEISLSYFELLTPEELQICEDKMNVLDEKNRKYFRKNGYRAKLPDESGLIPFCPTDAVCNSCYQALLQYRKKSKSE